MKFPLTSNLSKLYQICSSNNIEIRIVGGAVRNFLMNLPIKDVDLACNCNPEILAKILEKNGVKIVKNAIKYGTVIALMGDEKFEITSLRSDIECYGRDAEVNFSSDWKEDAKRRDFTINALYLDFEGNIYDYFDGLGDIKDHVVKFIDDPNQRIQEDHLRILRFFRFLLFYGDLNNIHEDSLVATIKNCQKIVKLSTYRIKDEFFKILSCDDDAKLLALLEIMSAVLNVIFNTNSVDLRYLKAKPAFFNDEVHKLIAIALGCEGEVENILKNFGFADKFVRDLARNIAVTGEPWIEMLAEINKTELLDMIYVKILLGNAEIEDYFRVQEVDMTKFPINGNDISPLISGAEIGRVLKIAKKYWIKNNFTTTKEEILNFIGNE